MGERRWRNYGNKRAKKFAAKKQFREITLRTIMLFIKKPECLVNFAFRIFFASPSICLWLLAFWTRQKNTKSTAKNYTFKLPHAREIILRFFFAFLAPRGIAKTGRGRGRGVALLIGIIQVDQANVRLRYSRQIIYIFLHGYMAISMRNVDGGNDSDIFATTTTTELILFRFVGVNFRQIHRWVVGSFPA